MPLKLANLQEQYEKSADLKKPDVAYLQEWLVKQPHLPSVTEEELVLFLHSCFYSVERTKTVIDCFFTIKTACPELFGKKDLNNLKISLDEAVYAPLPMPTPEGYQVMFIKLLDCNPDTFNYENHLKYLSSCMQIWLMQKGIVEGIVLLIDMDGLKLGHVTRVPLTTVKKSIIFLQEALPVRLKAVHCINTVPFIDKILTLFKPFMNSELINILHFHKRNLDTLYQKVPLECLPIDYGGAGGYITDLHKLAKHLVLDNLDFIEEFEAKLVDERKRQDKTKNASTIFGIEGSFKKLDID